MSISGGPPLDEIRRLEDDFAAAMTRMHAFGNDLARLRARLAAEAATTPAATAQAPSGEPTTSAPAAPGPAAPGPVPQRPGAVSPPPPPPRAPEPVPALVRAGGPQPARVPLWEREGVVVRVLGVVGAAITLIGVAFLLAIAISIGIFGPVPRVVSGALLAVGLVVAAHVVRRRGGGTAGAVGLAATGFAAAYLDVLAVARIYEWVPTGPALVIAGGIALVGLLIARSWGSQLLASLTVLGVALLAPAVGYDREILTGAFLLVLAVASWPAQVGRRWHLLEAARVVPVAVHLALVGGLGDQTGAAALLGLLLVVLVIGTSLAGSLTDAAPPQLGLLVPVASLPLVVAATSLGGAVLGAALLVALTLSLVVLAALAEQPDDLAAELRLVEVALPTAGATSLLAAAVLTDGTSWGGPLAALVAVAWAVAAALRGRVTGVVALGVTVVCAVGSLTLLPFVLLRGWAGEVVPAHLLTVVGLVVATLVLTAAARTSPSPGATVVGRVTGAGAVLWAGAAAVLAGALVGQLADVAETGFITGQAGATVLWLVIAAALVRHGIRHGSIAQPAGLALAALSVAKLLFFDLAFLDGLARVLSFIVGGLLLLAMGAGYHQALERARRQPPTLPVDNSGHRLPSPPTV